MQKWPMSVLHNTECEQFPCFERWKMLNFRILKHGKWGGIRQYLCEFATKLGPMGYRYLFMKKPRDQQISCYSPFNVLNWKWLLLKFRWTVNIAESPKKSTFLRVCNVHARERWGGRGIFFIICANLSSGHLPINSPNLQYRPSPFFNHLFNIIASPTFGHNSKLQTGVPIIYPLT